MNVYYVSSPKMTVSVTVDEGGRIVEGPPIVRRWIGQPFDVFLSWLGRRGRRVVEL